MIIEVFILIIGLVIGSFLNVCIYRIPKKQSVVFPPSHCMNCNTELKPLDLIPVLSYIFLRGKCRYCGKKISIQYSLIELATSIIFVLLYDKYKMSFEFLSCSFLMAILIVVFLVDAYYMIIPNILIKVGFVGGTFLIIYNCFNYFNVYGDRDWWNPFLGMAIGGGSLLIISFIGMIILRKKEVMGMGDVKLLALIGVFLGWRMTLITLYLSIVLTAVTSIILITFKIKNRKEAIPFGPFIVISCFITILYGWNLYNLYLSL